MTILFSNQSSLTETYLRRCFQPTPAESVNEVNRFMVMVLNTSWTLHSTLFQVALAIESSVKLLFGVLLLNRKAAYTNAIRLLSVPFSLILTTTAALTIALAILWPETALRANQSLIGYTQILPSYFDVKDLEFSEIVFAGSTNGADPVFTNPTSARSLFSLTKTYPRSEDLFLFTRAVNQHWQPLPNLLRISEQLGEDTYTQIKSKVALHLQNTPLKA